MASSVFNIGRGLYISNAVRRRMAECHRGPGVLDGVLAVAVAVAIHSTISKFRVLTNIMGSFRQHTRSTDQREGWPKREM